MGFGGINYRQGFTPWVFAIAIGLSIAYKHQFLQRIVDEAANVQLLVIIFQRRCDGQVFQVAATFEDASAYLFEALRQDDGLERCTLVEEVGWQGVVFYDIHPTIVEDEG